jgi:SAM-dependent methyltransferase
MTDTPPSSATSSSAVGLPAVDDAGVRLAPESKGVVDVLFDGRRIWSVDRSMLPKGEDRLVEWPHALRRYLDGVTRVTLRDHGSGETLLNEELTLGPSSERIRVVDAAGEPLALSKWGDLVQPFDSTAGGAIQATIDQTVEVLEVLRQEAGLPAFITYGTLLGAVRDGRFIGHDDDVDVAYLSVHEHPADVARESFGLQRIFRRRGWEVRRFSAGFLQVIFEGPDGKVRHVDVFTCFLVLDRFYQAFAVGADLPRSAIVPLGETTLEGRRLPAPADPDALLEATYGPAWRVQFKIPSETRRRIGGWLGGYHVNVKYWEEFYSSRRSAAVPDEPSAFARWVGEREAEPTSVVDVGSGTGRDSLWFARAGHRVLGLDYARPAVEHAETAARGEGLEASFEFFDLYDLRQVLATGARLAQDGRVHALYGRFLIHALEDAGRHHLWRLAEMALRSGGRLYLEFRTGEDAGEPHEFGEHFRRFLSPDLVVEEIESRNGRVEHREEGHGLAVYKHEDPHVCRLVVGWPQS